MAERIEIPNPEILAGINAATLRYLAELRELMAKAGDTGGRTFESTVEGEVSTAVQAIARSYTLDRDPVTAMKGAIWSAAGIGTALGLMIGGAPPVARPGVFNVLNHRIAQGVENASIIGNPVEGRA
jgi:hypothetical protein